MSVLSSIPSETSMVRIERRTLFALIAGAAFLIVGCGHVPEPKAIVPQAASVEVAAPIPHFIDHLRRNGIVLGKDREISSWWKVVEPPSEGPFDVVVCLKEFPPGSTASEMEHVLLLTSLALQLNAPARLAMSYPGLQGHTGATREALLAVPDAESMPISKRLIRLFQSYQGPKSVGESGL